MRVGQDANDISIDVDQGVSTPVQIGRDLLGTLELASSQPGTVLTGQVNIGRHLVGNLEITYDVAGTDPDPAIVIGGDLIGRVSISGDLQRHLEVQGDVSSAGSQSSIFVGQGLTGQIRVYGSLKDNSGVDYEIEVTGTMTSTGAVTVDYDGYHVDDKWKIDEGPTAVVRVNGVNYSENTPSARIYEITCPKADLNNDDDPNAYDIDPFIIAASNNCETFGNWYPGLGGSCYYHGDTNCDDAVNAYDIDSFILRIGDPDKYARQYPGCDPCLGGDGGGEGGGAPLEPADVAALFEDYVAPVRMPLVVEMVAEQIDYHADTPCGEFWEAVLAELD
ncbi:MAG: hypothetical protein ABIG44_08040 [Planctomycetota bacterium]